MSVDLASIPGALVHRLGLPRPDWAKIGLWLEDHLPKDRLDDAWGRAAQQWLEHLRESLPADYTIEESENFLLLSADDARKRDRLLGWCEGYRRRILDTLKGVASDADGYGPHVVLAFHDIETYYDYIADFYPDSGEFGLSIGIFLNSGYGHFALCPRADTSIDRTIAHEMTHALVRHLPWPLWLNEGVTQVVEDIVVGSSNFVIHGGVVAELRAYWNEGSIHAFWSGKSFYFADEGQGLSYNLSQLLVRNLMRDCPSTMLDFLRGADFVDAGNQALVETCGVDLSDRVAPLLGPGDWGPRSNYVDLENEQTLSESAVIAEELGFSVDAIRFLLDALHYAPQYQSEELQGIVKHDGHFTAAQFCEVYLNYARDCYEEEYRDVLKQWGIHRSEELGRLVFGLAERNLVEKTERDRLSDFDNLFRLE